MAILSIAVAVEKLIALIRAQSESRTFARAAGPLIDGWDFGGLGRLADKAKAVPLAQLVDATVRTYVKNRDIEGALSPVELARREVGRESEAVGGRLRRGMSMLASIGSIAPFVGLLGTVIGIIAAFQGIAATGSRRPRRGIRRNRRGARSRRRWACSSRFPRCSRFNFLNGRIDSVESALGPARAGELLDQMENEHGRRS